MRASVTRAAEGFDRRSFTVDEILRMQETGIISEDENFELIEGEIVPMQAKTHLHELMKSALGIAISRALPSGLWLGFETTIYLTPRTFVEPDLVVYPHGLKLETVKGGDIVLAIEVALTSLPYDRGLKSELYARHGVQEFWVVDAAQRQTYAHRAPVSGAWTERFELGPLDELRHPALPGFALKLGDV
jgi:Uma2 family endonuclease